MKTTLLLLVILLSNIFSQYNSPISVNGCTNDYEYLNGQLIVRTVTGNESIVQQNAKTPVMFQQNSMAGSLIRWSFLDAVAIADRNSTSGNGQFHAVGWGLNVERVSLYGNTNSTP